MKQKNTHFIEVSDVMYFASFIYKQPQNAVQKAFKCVFNDLGFVCFLFILRASCLSIL